MFYQVTLSPASPSPFDEGKGKILKKGLTPLLELFTLLTQRKEGGIKGVR